MTLDPLGLFVIFAILEHFDGTLSEEKTAAESLHKIMTHPAAAALTPSEPPATSTATPAAAPPPVKVPGVPVAIPPVVPTAQGPATPASSPAFPQAVPPSVPTFPDGWVGGQPAGWRFATPVAPEVAKRAMALLPTLWAKGLGTHVVEMTGAQWIAYNAEWHDKAKTMKGVTAYTPKAA